MEKSVKWIGIVVVIIVIIGLVKAFYVGDTSSGSDLSNINVALQSVSPEAIVPSVTPALAVDAAPSPDVIKPNKNFMHKITIETNKGTIVFETYDADAPKAAANFVTLAQKGFYDGVIFHRVISGFMIQGGDPTGTGRGGPNYQFEDELNSNTASYKAGYVRGTVAMANSGPNTNGSQFFIMHKDYALPHNYTIFGKVISGLDVVDKIAASKTDTSDRPLEKIVMNKVTVSQE